jgi:hypothetical protein
MSSTKAKVLFQLNDGSPDPRANVVAYQVTITNQGDVPIYLQEITPIYSGGVDYMAPQDSIAKLEERARNTCKELTKLLEDFHGLRPADEKSKLENIGSYWREITAVLDSKRNRVLRYYLRITWIPVRRKASKALRILDDEARTLMVESYAEAERQYLSMKEARQEGIPTNVVVLYDSKLLKLKQIESELRERKQSEFRTIDPGKSQSERHVFIFKRGYVDTFQYGIEFLARYFTEDLSNGGKDYQSAAESISKAVAPRTGPLSLIAVASSLLGVLLRLSQRGIVLEKIDAFNEHISSGLILQALNPFVIPAILSYVFYNLYEYTDISKGLKVSINWRGALLLGFLSGFMSDRIMRAFASIIGN